MCFKFICLVGYPRIMVILCSPLFVGFIVFAHFVFGHVAERINMVFYNSSLTYHVSRSLACFKKEVYLVLVRGVGL